MISTLDIAWAAGFIEGEGCFQNWGWNTTVTVSQVQREPLEKLHRLFGGKLARYEHRSQNPKWNAYYRWQITNQRSREVMMTIYVLMSPKRRAQIAKVLGPWRSRRRPPEYRTHCPRGHAYTPENTMVNSFTGGRYCRECANGLRRGKYHGRDQYLQ